MVLGEKQGVAWVQGAGAGAGTAVRPEGFGMLMHVLMHSATPALALKITKSV